MRDDLYTATFTRGLTIEVEGFEIPVSLPDKPPQRLMRNYGLPLSQQKFRKEDFSGWKTMNPLQRYDFVQIETHRRYNGEWWLIKGKEVYVNGWAYFYFNYWYAEYGDLPDFRMEAVEWFWVWDHCFRDPDCFGILDIKGRRAGDTEKSLCVGYDTVTRYKKSWFGMQNLKDEDAQDNFMRTVDAHKKMQPWFKPVSASGESPKKELEFRYPSDRSNAAQLARDNNKRQFGIGSRIDYGPTKLATYDGKRLRVWHMDEPGKLDPLAMDLLKQWGIIQPALSLYNKRLIIGKAIFTTTVEKIKSGDSVLMMRYFWDNSDPNQRVAGNRTSTGLYRYLRPFWKGAECDEFGFPMVEQAEAQLEAEAADLLAKGDNEGVANLRRKFPRTIDDALSTAATDCPLFPALLDAQIQNINRVAERGSPQEKERAEVRGNLVWTNGFGSSARWAPDPIAGRWYISQHPTAANNVDRSYQSFHPRNAGVYSIGVDPIDHVKPKESRHSKGAIAVYMPFNPALESGEIYGESDVIENPELMKTDQFVCVYKYRPEDPFEFYDDVAKTMFYYGSMAFIERDKPGVLNYLKQKGMGAFLAYKPRSLGVGAVEKQPGAKTSEALHQVFIPMVQNHILSRIATYRHKEQLNDFRNFDQTNMGKCDLLVASGFALMYALPVIRRQKKQDKIWSQKPW